MKPLFIVCIFFLHVSLTLGQVNFKLSEQLQVAPNYKLLFFDKIDTLFNQVRKGSISSQLIYADNPLAKDILEGLKSYDTLEKKLINFFPIEKDKFSLTFSFSDKKRNELICIFNCIGIIQTDSIRFTIPLMQQTKDWRVKKIGNITYFYKSKVDEAIAKQFDRRNSIIANKLGLVPAKLTFYVTDNYQEIITLLGYLYDRDSNGSFRDGYGPHNNVIFAIQGNADFSHDVFHFYSKKLHKNRNWITEEGLAYYWGNAYYTDSKKQMIEHPQLVEELKTYLKNNPTQSIYELFEKNTKIFNHMATEISVRSTISGILMKEIENKKGVSGLKQMIECGKGLDPFMIELNKLLGIDKGNFNEEIKKLLAK
jgi:hypothetical protein